jgi:hypothetical protein
VRPIKGTKGVSEDFNEAVLRTVHNFYLIEKQRLTLKASHVKMGKSAFLKEICPP